MNPKDYNLRLFRQGPTEASTLPPAYQGDTAPEILAKLVTVDGMGSGLDADLLDGHDSNFYAPIGNAALTGNPTAPTPSFGDNDTSIATTAFVLANAAPIANPSANLIINGDMATSQENGTTVIAPANNAARYLVDQWYFSNNQAANTAVWSAAQGLGAAYPGFTGLINLTATTAWSAGAAGDNVQIDQIIEGQRWAKLGWGTANALPVSIGFWVAATVAGTFGLSIRNAAANRSYVVPITVTGGGAWQYKTATIPGDIVGTWPTDTGIGAHVTFCFGSGSTLVTANGNVWQAGNFAAPTGVTNFFATANNAVYLTGVSLIAGNTPVALEQSPAIRRDLADELQLCQRYWERCIGHYRMSMTSNGIIGVLVPFKISKRAAPTMAYMANGAAVSNSTFQQFPASDIFGAGVQFTGTANSDSYNYGFSITAHARL